MYIKTLPEDYCGVFSPVIYTLSGANPDEIVEVAITGKDGQTAIGNKRLHGETEYKINTAPYLQRRLSVEPLTSQPGGFIQPTTRTAEFKIRIGSTLSSPTGVVTGGYAKCKMRTKLSGAPGSAIITPGEKDEIAFITSGTTLTAKASLYGKNGSVIHPLSSGVSPAGLSVFLVDMKTISESIGIEDFDEMQVEISDNNGLIATQDYIIAPQKKSSVRICWQNQYGQVDYYSFDILKKSTISHKSMACMNDMYKITGISSEFEYVLTSQCEPEKSIEWLGYILSSPQVWMIENGKAFPVYVTTSKAVIKSNSPQALLINIRQVVNSDL